MARWAQVLVRVNIDPLYDNDDRICGALKMFKNVTNLTQAQASQLLAAIVESSDDAIVSKDVNGIITSWNQAAQRLFGYTADEVIGKPVTLLIPPERHDEEPGILDSIKRGQSIEHYETVRRRKDGSLLDISLTVSPIRDVKGNIVGASKIARDITRRKRAEVALRASEDRFRTLTMNAPAAIFIKDLAGRYTLANPLACQALGRVDGVVGLTDHDLLPHEVADSLRGHDADVISTGRPIEREEVVQRNGFNRNFLSVKFPLLDGYGQVISVCGVAIDITERKLMEKVLRENEEKLREQAQELEQQLIMSGRLVSLGEVTASMAHEFNNPLGIIMGFVEDMLSSMDPADPNYRPLQIIDEESKRCRQIVRDLMEYARPRSSEFCSTSITNAIEKTLQLVENRLYKQKVTVEKALEPDLPRIQADSPQLEQVLVNLYLNAIDAMPEGGKLMVEARMSQTDGTAPMAVITVADTGFGIAETDLPKIFHPFFTAKKRRGMGLGLPICQRIVKNHGGRIEVESQSGTGSTFKIYLPLEQSPQRHPGAPVTEH
jgi:PAS domain S-box-containing protein